MAVNHKQTCSSTCHVRIFTQRLRHLCWYVCQCKNGLRRWKIGFLKQSMYGTRDAASKWVHAWLEHLSWGCQLGLSSKNLLRHEGHRVSGMTHCDDFVVTGPTNRLADLKNKNLQECTHSKHMSPVTGRQKASKRANRRLHWLKVRSGGSARSQACCCAGENWS